MTNGDHHKRTDRRAVSVVIIARNEAQRLDDCLKSVAWADEIVVLDSGSTDATLEIARRYTDKVFEEPWKGFGPQKKSAVARASHDWILSVDCDERVTPELEAEIRQLPGEDGSCCAYSVPRRTFLGDKEIRHCGWYPDRTIRLFDRRKANFTDAPVHERVVTVGNVGMCRGHLLHYSFAGLGPLLKKLNQYSDLAAEQMYREGRACGWSALVLRPLFALVKTYVLKRGFLDGVEGLEISVTTALLTFAKYIKLRELHAADKDRTIRR